jgi:pyridoxal phosphate enzyme (YggS family)
MGISGALRSVRERIKNSAIKSGRKPDDIKLIAVSKTIELERIIEAVQAGVTILGENRVQEANKKISDFREQITPPNLPLARGGTKGGVEWHLIGNLQKNKAKTAVQLFDLIHSVDSTGLTEELNKYAQRIGKKQRVIIQVKLSDEVAKHGVSEKDLMELLEKVTKMDNLKLEGLMTIPPFFKDPEKSVPYFRKLRQTAEKAVEKGFSVSELSMGMSNDFEIAIEEGATMVRIGTAIFGERL